MKLIQNIVPAEDLDSPCVLWHLLQPISIELQWLSLLCYSFALSRYLSSPRSRDTVSLNPVASAWLELEHLRSCSVGSWILMYFRLSYSIFSYCHNTILQNKEGSEIKLQNPWDSVGWVLSGLAVHYSITSLFSTIISSLGTVFMITPQEVTDLEMCLEVGVGNPCDGCGSHLSRVTIKCVTHIVFQAFWHQFSIYFYKTKCETDCNNYVAFLIQQLVWKNS